MLIIFATAIFWANSPLDQYYFNLFKQPLTIHIKNITSLTSLHQIINEGLMTLFFFLVTLEVKRELLVGELNSIRKSLLPLIGAMGGMLLPAAIYLILNFNNNLALRGWAIPTATDIAFSLAILTLLRTRLPPALKAFLTALAIIDDLGAIIIIAIFYTNQIHFFYLSLAFICLFLLVNFNYLGITKFSPYFCVGLILWYFISLSGIHVTISGVILGFTIPLRTPKGYSPLKRLEHKLQPFISFFVLPLFALANTGLSFKSLSYEMILNPITLGIFWGLFIGKQLGVFSACWLAIKTKLAKMPRKMTLLHLYGLSIICGIGFTMSLFIGDLAFGLSHSYGVFVKLGVLLGSIVSGLVGLLILYLSKLVSRD